MVAIARVRIVWSGFVGAPGYTNLFFRDFAGPEDQDITEAAAGQAVARVRTFLQAIAPNFPNDVTFNIDPAVDVLEDTSGELLTSFQTAATAPVPGTQVGTFSSASGAVISWRTSVIRKGRRIRGRTFLVPLAGICFNTSGRLDAGVQGQLQTAAQALAAQSGTPDLGVYARPSGPGAVDGQWAVVTAATVPELPAVLRSRRD